MTDFEKKDGFIWMDGEFVEWSQAKVHVLTHTLHYGLGVFEGVRAYLTDQGTKIFRLEDHTNRLFESADAVNMEIPFTKEKFNEVQKEIFKVNNLKEGYIRPMCFYGAQGMGLRADNLKTHCIVAAWEWPSYMSPEAFEEGIKIKISSYNIIYEVLDYIKQRMSGLLAPDVQEKITGTAQILEIFKVSGAGKVAGSKVTEGEINSTSDVRIIRDGAIIYTGKVSTIFREKNQVKQVSDGQECGITVKDYMDFQKNDTIEAFSVTSTERSI